MLKQIAFHKTENKRKEEKHMEAKIRMQAAFQIEETRRKDFLQPEEMLEQADCHQAEMNWVKGQYEAVISNLDQEIKRQEEEIKWLEEELDDQHCNPSE